MDRIIRKTPLAADFSGQFTDTGTSTEDSTGRSQLIVGTENSAIAKVPGLFEYTQDVSESKAGVVRLLTKVHFPVRMPDDPASEGCTCGCNNAAKAAFEDGITAHAVITIPAKYRKALLTGTNISDAVGDEPGTFSVPMQAALAALVLADRLVGEYGKAPTGFHHAILTVDTNKVAQPFLTYVQVGGSLQVTAAGRLLNQGNVVKRILGLTK